MHDNNSVTRMSALAEHRAYHHQPVQNSHYNLRVSLKEETSSTIF